MQGSLEASFYAQTLCPAADQLTDPQFIKFLELLKCLKIRHFIRIISTHLK